MDTDHPDYQTIGKVITEGITRAMYDALPLVFEPSFVENLIKNSKNTDFNFCLHRITNLRSPGKRYEVRLLSERMREHASLIVPLVMAGALSALMDNKENKREYYDIYKPAQLVEVGLYDRPPHRFQVLTHALNGGEIKPDGALLANQEYIKISTLSLAKELGLVPEQIPLWYDGEHFQGYIQAFILGINIDRSGDKPVLVFPVNCNEGYKFSIPELNMNHLPEEVVNKIRNGIDPDIIMEEWWDYRQYNNYRDPRAASQHIIDTKSLSKNVKLREIVNRLVVLDAYDLRGDNYSDTPTSDASLSTSAALTRINTSRVFSKTLSAPFFGALTAALNAAFPSPEVKPGNLITTPANNVSQASYNALG